MLVKICRPDVKLDNVRLIAIADKVCMIDEEDAERILKYKWKLRKVRTRYYAVRSIRTNGKEFLLPMHRQIMHTPRHQVVHHKNRYTLDNRKRNLQNMNQQEHHLLHRLGT